MRPTQTGAVIIDKYVEGVNQNDKGNPNSGGYVEDMMNNVGSSFVVKTLGSKKLNSPSVVENVGQAVAYMYQQPVDLKAYIADIMHSSGLATPAYAQGVGFSSLDPVLSTWKVFRNVAYLFYVLLFLGIGFAIMFRQKIGSQAAVTVQQALPRIIISLIAVTFSYAIAGLLIEIMYLVMFLIVGLFPINVSEVPGAPGAPVESLRNIALGQDIFQIGIRLLSGDTLGNAKDSISQLVGSAFNSLPDVVSKSLGAISGITFMVVFALATLYSIFRLFFELLKTYVSIIIAVVLSPIALMLGALPGNNALSAWLKALIANLAVFPAILLVLVFSFLLKNSSLSSEGGFLPPYLIGRGSGSAISTLLGLGIILILPEVAAQVKKIIGGNGGIFESFANNFVSALEKGWKGDALIPGIAATNLKNLPVGGFTGENLARKALIYSGAAPAGALGYFEGRKGRANGNVNTSGYQGMKNRSGSFGRYIGKTLGDKQINPDTDPNKTGTPHKKP